MLEQFSEPLVTRDLNLTNRSRSVDQLIIETLVIPFDVVVANVLSAGLRERRHAEEVQFLRHSLLIDQTKRSA
jgi:hypothetical protein